jgi:predicted TIM-barrel fold metal-dependent hydrolase
MMAYRGIETVVKEVGAERVLHGSCNPLQNPAIGPLKIRKADIGEEEKKRILGGNAMRLSVKARD